MPVREVYHVDGLPFAVWQFGSTDARRHIYLQGALHADEVAASMALEQLLPLLTAAEAEGRLRARFTLVPHCNPVGLSQFKGGRHIGRFTLEDDLNYNRGVPDLAPGVIAGLRNLPLGERTRATATRLGLAQLKAGSEGLTGRAALHNRLMQLSWGAERVYDLHTDMEALVHLYTSESSWAGMQDLAALTGTRVVMLADQTADGCFDEAHSLAWAQIAPHLVEPETAQTCACTLELRGLSDASDAQGRIDAAALMADFTGLGLITPAAAALLSPRSAPHVLHLDGVEMVTAPFTAIFLPCVAPGDTVVKGQPVGDLIDTGATDPGKRRLTLRAGTDGLVFARWHQRVISAGMAACKIAGPGPALRADARLLD